MVNKTTIWIGIIVFIVIISGFLLINNKSTTSDSDTINSNADDTGESTVVSDTKVRVSDEPNWRNIELKDINTQTSFKISDFKEKPILLEAFAVWCPTCKRQQDEVKKLHEEIGDDVISISLDTDENENEKLVLSHLTKHEYDWYFAISPSDLTQSLIKEFGPGVVSAPSAPVIAIDIDGNAKLLKRGVKSSSELKTALGI
jgi:thiol-disulfide isomerase/thioredoxin